LNNMRSRSERPEERSEKSSVDLSGDNHYNLGRSMRG
jgi:hypothetical protein